MLDDPIELAWVAGILDGEGCIGVYEAKSGIYLKVAIDMCHEATVKRVHNILKTGYFRSLRNYEPNRNNDYKWRFDATGGDAIFLLKLLKPYVFTKKKQLDLALQWAEDCYIGKGARPTEEQKRLSEQYRLQMKDLNRRGRPQ
jgi:hypothetical protein